MTTYAYAGVDTIVDGLLGPEIGYACDVGANDGTFFSNTKMFEDNGWTVLCVEPNPLLAEAGAACRKIWKQVACGPEDLEEGDFWAIGGPPYASHSALAVGDGPIEGRRLPYGVGQPPEELRFKVLVRRLDRLLEEAEFPRLDYLTIDAEGYEKEIMKGFTIERWKPRVIVLEDNYGDVTPPAGYALVRRVHVDNIFQREPDA